MGHGCPTVSYRKGETVRPIQKTIRLMTQGKPEPTVFDMQCFIGMIETGEATVDDFRLVGGIVLAASVAKSVQVKEDMINDQ